MRRTIRTIATLLFIGAVAACGLAVLYFGTSTGIVSSGTATSLGGATKTLPYYAQVGWIRNTAPWPVTITSITTNVAHSTTPPAVYIERTQSTAATKPDTVPLWTKEAARPPYELVGGSLRYLGFAVMPVEGHVASFTTFTVTFSGPLGFTFQKTFSGTNVAARSSTLPATILAADPSVDNTSLNSYIALLRGALLRKSPAKLAVVMGNDATVADATALLKKQKGYTTKYLLSAVPAADNPALETLTFYRTDITKNALPPIPVAWAGYRWSVIRS
jgi:hypothetical protein